MASKTCNHYYYWSQESISITAWLWRRRWLDTLPTRTKLSTLFCGFLYTTRYQRLRFEQFTILSYWSLIFPATSRNLRMLIRRCRANLNFNSDYRWPIRFACLVQWLCWNTHTQFHNRLECQESPGHDWVDRVWLGCSSGSTQILRGDHGNSSFSSSCDVILQVLKKSKLVAAAEVMWPHTRLSWAVSGSDQINTIL